MQLLQSIVFAVCSQEGYDRIIPIDYSEDPERARTIEAALVEQHLGANRRCRNKQPGGSGLNGDRGPFFVYVAFGKRKRIDEEIACKRRLQRGRGRVWVKYGLRLWSVVPPFY